MKRKQRYSIIQSRVSCWIFRLELCLGSYTLLKHRDLLACVVVCGLVLTAWKQTPKRNLIVTHTCADVSLLLNFFLWWPTHIPWFQNGGTESITRAFRFPPLLKTLGALLLLQRGGDGKNKISLRVFAPPLLTYKINQNKFKNDGPQ